MNESQLNEARTNPEFLNYLEQTEKDAIETENIEALYEVLDSLLILDLDENRINKVYENILRISFEKIGELLNKDCKLSLENEELFYVRSFYEHAIEKWSYGQTKNAKELFFVLSNIITDEKLIDSLQIHIIACSKGMDLDTFYHKKVDAASAFDDEKYGYFIINFQFDTKSYLKDNSDILIEEFKNLKHLLD